MTLERVPPMARIDVLTETEGHNHWSYEVRVSDAGRRHDYRVTLNWADYDLWSHGRVSPYKVVAAAFEFLLQRESAENILARFDCSLIRRRFPCVDAELPKMV